MHFDCNYGLTRGKSNYSDSEKTASTKMHRCDSIFHIFLVIYVAFLWMSVYRTAFISNVKTTTWIVYIVFYPINQHSLIPVTCINPHTCTAQGWPWTHFSTAYITPTGTRTHSLQRSLSGCVSLVLLLQYKSNLIEESWSENLRKLISLQLNLIFSLLKHFGKLLSVAENIFL